MTERRIVKEVTEDWALYTSALAQPHYVTIYIDNTGHSYAIGPEDWEQPNMTFYDSSDPDYKDIRVGAILVGKRWE